MKVLEWINTLVLLLFFVVLIVLTAFMFHMLGQHDVLIKQSIFMIDQHDHMIDRLEKIVKNNKLIIEKHDKNGNR
jgi:hypothetical protein